MKRLRGALVVALLLALVVGVGGVETLPPGGPDRLAGEKTAADQDSGLLSRLGDAARALVGGGSTTPRQERVSPGLTVERTAPAGRTVKPAKRVREVVARRTATTRVFEMSDGRVQAEVSTKARFYRDAAGRYQPIDTRVRAAGAGAYANTSNTFTSRFAGRSDDLARFELGGESWAVSGSYWAYRAQAGRRSRRSTVTRSPTRICWTGRMSAIR
jgi:hypothetical protein